MSNKQKAVVLLQFGGPDSLDAVEPFLYNLFRDSDIVQIPLGAIFQKPVAKMISLTRAKRTRERYGLLGGKSPIVETTFKQQQALQKALDAQYGKDNVYVGLAMRYWDPLTNTAIEELQKRKIEDVFLLPLYAQYSITNAKSCFNEWDRETKRLGVRFNEKRIEQYYEHPSFLAAFQERIEAGLKKFDNEEGVYILFSAHGTPVDLVKKGDPYSEQVRQTMELLMSERKSRFPYSLSFQSKVGPKKWLEPDTDSVVEGLAANGLKKLLVVPISFVSDHIETSLELNIELREEAEELGIEQFIVCEGLNESPLFIETLTQLSIEALDSF